MDERRAGERDAQAGSALLAEVLDGLRAEPGFPDGGRVLVAMSGGIDSSVAAALLQAAGVEVIGVSMRLFDRGAMEVEEGSEGSCCSIDDFQDARRVAQGHGFSHFILDLEDRFRADVMEPFVQAYLNGLTPNPCVNCNKNLKFDALFERADALGASHVATGHYARVCKGRDGYRLRPAIDQEKDQSYFLYHLNQNTLSRVLFPLGGLTKPQVREMARTLGLHLAEKPESQEICFVPTGRYDQFLVRTAGLPESVAGEIRHLDGRLLGHHGGHWRFTVGQRRGLGVAAAEPLFVVRISPASNTVWVGSVGDLGRTVLTAVEVNWCEGVPEGPFCCRAKIRSRTPAAEAQVIPRGPDRAEVVFAEPQRAVAPGQAVVFYADGRVLGGGWIAADPPPAQE